MPRMLRIKYLRTMYHVWEQRYRVLKPNRVCTTFCGWPWIDRFMAVWKQCGFRPVSHLMWVKSHCSREGYTRGYHEVGFLLGGGSEVTGARQMFTG